MADAPLRLSPLYDTYREQVAEWTELNGMPLPRVFKSTRPPVWISDASALARCGCKGPGAADWLASRGLPVPAAYNSWAVTEGGLVARLAATEFLIENRSAAAIGQLKQSLARGARSATGPCYPVMREDAALVLGGPLANDILLQTCSFDFASLDLKAQPLVMTSMVGVSVLVIPREHAGETIYRLWCDPTFGAYLWRTLLAIVREQGGDATGFDVSL